MNIFSERYKSLDTVELLKILDSANDYQPEAVEAAETELHHRHLSENELRSARSELEKQKLRLKAIREKREEQLGTIGRKLEEFLGYLNPIQKELPSGERIIRTITLVLSGIYLYAFLVRHLSTLAAVLKSNYEWDFFTVLSLVAIIYLPLAIVFFARRKTIGWMLLTIRFSFTLPGTFYGLVTALQMSYTNTPGILDEFMKVTPPVYYVSSILFQIALVIALFRKDVREVFAINLNRLGFSVALGFLAALLIMLFLIFS